MKIFVTDKYTVLTAALVIAVAIAAFPLCRTAVETSSTDRSLPIYSVEREDNKIAITFDCAWGADDVDAIISALGQHNCRATFFVLGSWAEKYPEAVKKLSAAGHEIGGHSYNHAYYTQLSPEDMEADMEKCDAAIESVLGHATDLFRVPAGDYNNSVIDTVQNSGRFCIQWDADSLDYRDLTPEQMEERIMSKVQKGSILLFHTGTKNTAAALPQILTRLENEGYAFCPVGELIYRDSYAIDPAGRQFAKKPYIH